MAFVPYMVGGFAIDKLMGGNGVKGALAGTGLGMFAGPAAAGAAVTSGGASTLGSGAALMSGASTAPLGGAALGSGMGLSSIANPLAGATPLSSSGMGLSSIANPLGGASPISSPTFESINAMSQVNPATTGGASEGISMYTPEGLPGTVKGNTGLIGQQTSNQAWDAGLTERKGLLDTSFENASAGDVFDYAGNKIKTGFNSATDYIDKEYEDMTSMEKLEVGMGAAQLGTTDETNNQIQAQAPRVLGKTPGKDVTAPILSIDIPDSSIDIPDSDYSATTIPQNLSRAQLKELKLQELYGY